MLEVQINNITFYQNGVTIYLEGLRKPPTKGQSKKTPILQLK